MNNEIYSRVFNRTKKLLLILIISTFGFSSCKKFVEIEEPPNLVIGNNAFANDASATSTVLGIYSDMSQSIRALSVNATLYAGLSADELITTSSTTKPFLDNDIDPSSPTLNTFWVQLYAYIYDANAVIEGLEKSAKITPSVKKQLMGEAKFIRAFCHFYLVNFFGDIPIITSTDYRVNGTLPRAITSQVYDQIITDLKDAKNLLSDEYPSVERVRPNKWAATALLARCYLYIDDWESAEVQSSLVINSGAYTPLPVLEATFLKSSKETIWQLMPVSSVYTAYAQYFIPSPTSTSIPFVYLREALVTSFEPGDQRVAKWIGSKIVNGQTYYYAHKYKVWIGATAKTEYGVVLRVSEQYLIRAEARAKRNNLTGAINDLNIIRARAGLSDLPPTLTQDQVILAIEHERRSELFTEWGHRWFDLKRTKRADEILRSIKATTWTSTDTLYPVPSMQIAANPFLTQNAGY